MKSEGDKLPKEDKHKIEKGMLSLGGQSVFETYGTSCEVCGMPACDPHHFFPRGSYPNMKYEVKNGVPLCQVCHGRLHGRQDPRINEAIIKRRGKEGYNGLNKRAKNTFPVTSKFLLDKKAELETIIYGDRLFENEKET